MTPLYARILRLKPIIEADEQLMREFRRRFDFMYGADGTASGQEPPDVIYRDGTHRRVFTHLGTVVDPHNDEILHIGLKLWMRDYPYRVTEHRNEIGFNEPLSGELGAFDYEGGERDGRFEDNSKGFLIPNIIGVVYDRRRKIFGMVTEDLSHGGRRIVTGNRSNPLVIVHEDCEEISYWADMKGIPEPDRGVKYFGPEALIVFP